ncbi:MAG: DUF2219 family protein [Flavobacteriaceae bacterium]
MTSQNTVDNPKNQIGISHDNDFLVITDRYYTFGLSFFYNRNLNKGIFNNNREQVLFKILQKAYTPSNIETENASEMDRPYAGFLGMETSWQTSSYKTNYRVSLLLGMVGPASGVGQFQRWYHDHIVKYKTPTWAQELSNHLYLNISLEYVKEWEIAPNPFGVRFAFTPSIVLGSKDRYLQPQITTFFGRRSDLQKSMAYGNLGNLEREIYFSIQLAYRWVGYNAFLDKNIPMFSIETKQPLFLFDVNFHHRFLTHEYRVGYHFTSSEAKGLQRHQYISLGYAKSF